MKQPTSHKVVFLELDKKNDIINRVGDVDVRNIC